VTEAPSLYRRHRPRAFDEVVGQEAVVRTLRNAVEQGKVHHAYLFVGSRGTGKTSMAKILAACLNCERGPTTQPCGRCESRRHVAGRDRDGRRLQQLGRRHPGAA
jgi:DNA polymerase III subunit gamma/tau